MPAETNLIEPKTDSIEMNGSVVGSFEAIADRLSSLQLFSMAKSQEGITLLRVESRDIQKKPFLFIIITLGRDKVSVKYTIALDSSPKMRRLYVLKVLMSVLSLVSDVYRIDEAQLFQQADSAIDEMLNALSQSYSSLFNNYDSLFNEYRETKRLNIELTASNKNLTVQAAQLNDDNKQLKDRLSKLETYSDEAMMVMVEQWLDAHSSTLDINEFADNYKIVPSRVEQILNKMVSQGYVELKG